MTDEPLGPIGMNLSYFGEAVRQVEDKRLLTGLGRFTDDIVLPSMAAASFLRSPHAHALIKRIDSAAAERASGVLAIFTGTDIAALGLGTLPCLMAPPARAGTRPAKPPRPLLARDRVRHVGEAVAMVVAESHALALDALELIEVDYEPLACVIDAETAVDEGAVQLHDEAARNICVDWAYGDAAAVEAVIAAARWRVSLRLRNNRVICNPLEPRGCLGEYDRGRDRFTLTTASQGVHQIRNALAEHVFKIPQGRLRVVTPDVGGSFGMKMFPYPEHALVLVAARETGRPVKWVAGREEGFVSDNQGRDQIAEATLALDEDGRFLALQVQAIANLGAYLSSFAPFIATVGGSRALAGPYATPQIHLRTVTAFSNTAPVDAYRGAGRPEVVYLFERLIDAAARETGLDRVALRRRNLIGPREMPYATAMGVTYDSGDFPKILDEALRTADWDGFEPRRAQARAEGRYRGIGLAFYVDPCGGARNQRADLRFHSDGTVTLLMGSQSTGMGHETAYAQIAAHELGLDIASIQVVQGDTDQIATGRGTSGSRSLPIGGAALQSALQRAIAKARLIAAHTLEAAPEDLELAQGSFRVVGTDRALDMTAIIKASFDPARLPPGLDCGLDQSADVMMESFTFPNGCHVCELVIEPETGEVTVERYLAVDDLGRVVNPMLVDGQLHGGIAQGIGQALHEAAVYDDEFGQLLSGSFLDYRMPRAEDLPLYETRRQEVPCITNPLGVKGCGEAGAIVAPAAVINAVIDALAPLGVTDIDMPATAQRIWRSIRQARPAQDQSL